MLGCPVFFVGIGGKEENGGGDGLKVICTCGGDGALCWGMGCPCLCWNWLFLGANCFVACGGRESLSTFCS